MNEQLEGPSPAEGWYTDPYDASRLRWWDGTGWTEHLHPREGEPAATSTASGTAPAAATPASTTPAAAPAGTPSAQPAQSPGAAPSEPAAAPGIVSDPAPAGAAPKGAVSEWFSIRSNQILFVVLLIAIALFVFVMVGGSS